MTDINIHKCSEIKAFIDYFEADKDMAEFWILKLRNDEGDVCFFFDELKNLHRSLANIHHVIVEYESLPTSHMS